MRLISKYTIVIGLIYFFFVGGLIYLESGSFCVSLVAATIGYGVSVIAGYAIFIAMLLIDRFENDKTNGVGGGKNIHNLKRKP